MTEVALDAAADPWIEGLQEGAWSRKENEIVAALLAAGGSPLGPDHPQFPEARDKIARAFVWANRALASQVRGERSFTPPDPLFTTPVPPPTRNGLGITLGDLIARYEADKGRGWSRKTRDGYILIFRALRELLGEHTPVGSIDRDDCRRVAKCWKTSRPITRSCRPPGAAVWKRQHGSAANSISPGASPRASIPISITSRL